MRKLLLTAIALALAAPALAAQQDIAQISAVTASREALRTAVNTQLSAVQSNFDEVYAVIDAGPVYVNASAPADTKVVWIDTDQSNTIKVHIGGVWTAVGTAGSGDDLGSAAYTDVVALWTTCTGYLKSDGTCDTPSGSFAYPGAGVPNSTGSAWGTSYGVVTEVGATGADTNLPTEQAVREGLATKADLSGNPSFPDGINTGASSTGPGFFTIVEDSDNGANYVGVGSPASNDNDLIVLLPTANPTAGQILVCAVPSLVTFADGVSRNATACSWSDQTTDTDDQTAAEVSYSNTTSGLTATQVQAALDEIEGRVDTNDGKTSNATHTGDVTGATELTIANDAVGTDELSNTLTLVTTGTIQGRVVVETDADGKLLDTGDNATMQLATGAGTWTLPDIDDADGLGWTVCVLSTSAAAVVVAPNAEDTITLDGTTDTAGDGITSASATGDFVCLMVTSSSSNVANWTVLGRSGTWTAN